MCLWICFDAGACLLSAWVLSALMLSGHVRVRRCCMGMHVSVLLMELCALLLAVDACRGC